MANSTKNLTSAKRTDISDCPVVKAAYKSCIGIDIHHSVLVCAFQRCESDNSVIQTEIQEFGTGAGEIQRFAQWCRQCHPDRIVMESTGVLWLSPYQALEDVGFTRQQLALINARDFKAVVGRKTDKKDAQNLAEYGRIGLVRASFVPQRRFREMRMVARQYRKLTSDHARCQARFLKLFNFVGCRLSNAFSDTNGKAAKAILQDFLETDTPLVKLIQEHGARLRRKPEDIVDALSFEISDDMRQQLKLLRKHLDSLEEFKSQQMQLLEKMQRNDQPHIERLMSIPGIKETAARLIFAEVTDDLSSFPNSEHFASWAGVCPGNNESAGKRRSGHAAKGNRYLRSALTECSQAISRMKQGELRKLFQAFKERRGHKRAIVALAHRLLVIIYSLIKQGKIYEEKPTDALDKARVNRLLQSIANLVALRYMFLNTGEVVNKETGEIAAVIR